MMLMIKKILTAVVNYPGVLIFFLVFYGIFFLRKKMKREGWIFVSISVVLYIFSMPLVSRTIASKLEFSSVDVSAVKSCDSIVLLGGGISQGVEDLSGKGIPSPQASTRIINATRLYRMTGKDIIVSGGSVLGSDKEAPVLKRFLVDLGVPEGRIIVEDRSRDTRENALFVSEICREKGFRRVLLVTSAFHMKRSLMLFEKNGLTCVPVPSASNAEKKENILLTDVLPSAADLSLNSAYLKEILGYLTYSIFGKDSF